MAGQAVKRMVTAGVASGDGAPAPQTGTRWQASRLRLSRRAAVPALGAGIMATVLASALMAAGPAAASAASPAARTTAASPAATAAVASGTPATRAAARLGSPAARWLATRARSGSARGMTPQARMAAAANAFGLNGAVLYGVSCTGRAQCTATGMASTRSGKNVKTLADRWNGTTWALQSTPTPTSPAVQGGTLSAGVSCTSSSACMSAGFSYGKKTDRLLGEGWNGHTWATQPYSSPAVSGEPSGISCTWAKDCTAVGGRDNGRTLAEHWNGRKWSAVATKHDGSLNGVSCPATGNCTAVGSNANGKTLAAHWNGKSWSDQSAANPQQISLLGSVSCAAVKACVAVGTGGTMSSSAISLGPIAEQWTGGKWAALTVPDPGATGDFVELNSVSCTSATSCMAVGGDSNEAGTAATTLAEQWNGTTWTVITTPSPATFSTLLGVSCPSATHCVAVGASSATASGAVSPLTEIWNGSTWTTAAAPR